MEKTNNQTAVEQFINDLQEHFPNHMNSMYNNNQLLLEQLTLKAKEIEKQKMIELVEELKDYTRESRNIIGFDEREASEFVEIFYNKTLKSE